MGRILADAQDRLASANGTFVQWIKVETGLSVGTVYRLINVYRSFPDSNLETATFAVSALYLLSDPSTPVRAREEAIRRATSGETITRAKARAIVYDHQAPKPPLPPRPPLPPSPDAPEYRQFECDELRPLLHDAGMPDAPQILSGKQNEPEAVPKERREQARVSLRDVIVGALQGVDVEDKEALESAAQEILLILGRNNSISIAARLGAELERGPKTLSDLVTLAAWVCDVHLSGVERDEYLRWRKRVLRLIDAITFGGGLPIYEHVLENDQICYSLIPDPPNCP